LKKRETKIKELGKQIRNIKQWKKGGGKNLKLSKRSVQEREREREREEE
jgi:hypothetical protein